MAEYKEYCGIWFTNPLDRPTEQEIAALEANLQAKLPASFRAYLDVANGATLFGYALDIAHPEKPVSRAFSTLYGTRPRNAANGMGSFEKELELSREAAQLPRQVLPFARDDSGCEAYLDLTPEGNGRVVVFVMGIPGHDDQPEDNAWVTVALSFEDFLKQLYVDVEDLAVRMEQAVREKDLAEQTRLTDFLDRALPDWKNREEFTAFAK